MAIRPAPDRETGGQRKPSGKRRLGTVLLVLVWLCIIALCVVFRDRFTVEALTNMAPENMALASVAMVFLFALKSVSIVIYSGLLYTVSGILFPLPLAIAVNILGMAIMISIPYGLGRRTGGDLVGRILNRYPKAGKIREFRQKNDFLFSFLVRLFVRIPSDILSLYMGAVQVPFRWYFSGSFLALLSHVITFSIMGDNITDITSPAFLISAGVEIAILVIAILAARFRGRRNAGNTGENPTAL